LRVQSPSADICTGACLRQFRPDSGRTKVNVKYLGKDAILVYFEYREFGGDNASIALYGHHAECSLPGHQLWINKLTGSAACKAMIREVHSGLAPAFEYSTTETIDARELIVIGGNTLQASENDP
jgi:hypothetical protein